MKKPKKTKINWNKDDGWSKEEQVGRNQVIEDYDAWLNEVFSVENLVKTMWSYYKEHNIIAEDRDILEGIAKSIIKQLGGER